MGTQLTAQLRAAVADGELGPGDAFPSIRDLAEATGVSVNTVRSAYARLENEGLVHTEHGRGTFVADERGTRRELRRQIERLEAAVARGPQRGSLAAGAPAGRLLSTQELRAVRDSLLGEVERLDSERAALMRRLSELDRLAQAEADAPAEEREPATGDAHSTTTSLGNVRLRWVGA